MIDIVASAWGQYKVKIIWLLAAGAVLITLHEVGDLHYMPISVAMAQDKALEAKLDESHRVLGAKIETNSKLLRTHIQQYHINENRKSMELAQDQLFDLDQYESINPPTQMTKSRRHELERKIEALKEQRECLLSYGEHCD